MIPGIFGGKMGVLLALLSLWGVVEAGQNQYQDYLGTSIEAIECLRAPSGLLKDKVFHNPEKEGDLCPLMDAPYVDTSPTNIALDILLQLGLLDDEKYRVRAQRNIDSVLSTLKRLSFHSETGLFFNRYNPMDPSKVSDHYVSAVDNLHLYLALWTLNHKQFSVDALGILSRMNFKPLLAQVTHLVHGGFEYLGGEWRRVDWVYRFFGSEGRAIYSLGVAFGLIPPGASKHWVFETLEDNGMELLRLWDGGAFQLLLPELLIGESEYSPRFKRFFGNYAGFIFLEQERRGLTTPASHSACQFSNSPDVYNGFSGNLKLVPDSNQGAKHPLLSSQWEVVFTPHALFLAAPFAQDRVLSTLNSLERAEGVGLYHERLGWFDALHVDGPQKGTLVPAVLALDHLMIALSIQKVQNNGATLSSTTLLKDQEASSRLRQFYSVF